eukprot:TRINITY_DN75807_c0_g1_i1.p1 TRINITY_DN75807_c0_g1~~TRINITY_DN75807_c0_g1_i1.p1  ORF type:complete len:363 (-),score=64.49 TRINITY_DN75807_c0_g1_i1:364-1452(-)
MAQQVVDGAGPSVPRSDARKYQPPRRVPRCPLPAPPLPESTRCFEEVVALRRYAAVHSGNGVSLVPREDRSRALAVFQAEHLESSMQANGKCGKCMLQLPYCICGEMARLREEVTAFRTGERVRFAVWMHVRERMRATNTGKLLEHVLPGSVVLTHDVPADEARFETLLEESKGRAIVLYPSEGAITPEQAIASFGAACESAGGASHDASGASACDAPPPLLAVLVDGTWRQARRMHRHLEALPHVILVPRKRSQFAWRRQTREDRISTVEAGALLLEDLGEKAEGAPAALLRGLEALNSAIARQSHFDTICNGPPPPEPGLRKRGAAKHRLPKRTVSEWSAATASQASTGELERLQTSDAP